MSLNSGDRYPTFTDYSVKSNVNPVTITGVGHPCSSMTISYRNESETEVRIKDRFGVNQILPGTKEPRPGNFVDIFLKWQMTAEAYKETCHDFRKRYAAGSPVTAELTRCWYMGEGQYGHRDVIQTYELHVEIKIESIRGAGGTIYLEELDLVVCLNGTARKKEEHPCSPMERVKKGIAAYTPHVGEETFLMSIRAVDNNMLASRRDRFMKIGDTVYHIPIERDLRYNDGVFVTSRYGADEKNTTRNTGYIKERFMSFEEADKLYQMFDTIEQAREGLSTEELRKEEIKRIEYERRIEDLERANEKLERDHNFWRERAQYEQETQQEKEERQKRRFNEENARDQTRSFTEWMKLVGGLMSGVIAFAAVCAKLKST